MWYWWNSINFIVQDVSVDIVWNLITRKKGCECWYCVESHYKKKRLFAATFFVGKYLILLQKLLLPTRKLLLQSVAITSVAKIFAVIFDVVITPNTFTTKVSAITTNTFATKNFVITTFVFTMQIFAANTLLLPLLLFSQQTLLLSLLMFSQRTLSLSLYISTTKIFIATTYVFTTNIIVATTYAFTDKNYRSL